MVEYMEVLMKMKKEDVQAASEGLSEDIFLRVTELTPMVNVDLLIRDEKNRVLLAWRDDRFAGKGWHIPGGIVRHKETFTQRLRKMSFQEIGTEVEYNPEFIHVEEIILPFRSQRSHFISFLFEGKLSSTYRLPNGSKTPEDAGYLKWHDHCPEDFLRVQDFYRKYIEEATNGAK